MSAEFRQRHMRVIELNENDVASQIRMNHGRELEVVDAALDQILQGLDAFAYVKQRPDSRLEDAQMYLAVRSFNSLHIARQLLEHGYYQQASALVRMAMEDQLVAEDAETHPPTLDALLHDNGSISSGDLTYGKMAERISPETLAPKTGSDLKISQRGLNGQPVPTAHMSTCTIRQQTATFSRSAGRYGYPLQIRHFADSTHLHP